VAVAASLLGLIGGTVAANAGTDITSPETITTVGTTTKDKFSDVGKPGPSVGDTFASTVDIKSQAGVDLGTERTQCTMGVGQWGFCTGAFVLGRAGLLDGREATTHWLARDVFAQRFPHSHFRSDVLYVSDGTIITSAGTVAAIDCCLHLVRQRHGADVANRMARLLVTPPHRQGGQAQYIEQPVPQLPSESRLPGVLEWARERLAEPLSLDTLADSANMSRRTFTRRFRETTGTTFIKWLNAERVARAQQLLETTQMPIDCIASEVGFGTTMSLRQQFAAQLGTTPSAYRRTFCKEYGEVPR